MQSIVITTLLGVSFLTTSILSTLLMVKARVLSRIFLSLASYGTAIWILAMLIFVNTNNSLVLIIATKMLYIAGAVIITNFIYFACSFLDSDIRKNKKIIIGAGIPLVLSIIFTVFTGTVIKGAEFLNGNRIVFFGPLYYFYGFYIILGAFGGYYYLSKKSRVIQDKIAKRQLVYTSFGTIVPISFGLLFDIILPFFGRFTFYWLGPVLATFFVIFTSYAIFKHHLFDIRVIAAELFTTALILVLFINVLISTNPNQLFVNILIFVLAVIFGVLLIRSVLKEVETRKKLTVAYEELKRIDVAKSEFMSMASHQLRTPLTSIKGYISMLLDGDYGPVEEKHRQVLDNVFQSSERLIKIVNDLLDVSRIELGKMELKKEKINLEDLVSSSCGEMKTKAEEKKLRLVFKKPDFPMPEISADSLKLRQVILNLIDNAVRYTYRGGIEVTVAKKPNSVLIAVSDTGDGLSEEEEKNIFSGFSRGSAGINMFVEGAGLGLYVAKKYLDLHQGRIWAESAGKGKGSTFYAELPIC